MGGVTNIKWNSNGGYTVGSGHSIIFKYYGGQIRPVTKTRTWEVYHNRLYGAVFHDLYIKDDQCNAWTSLLTKAAGNYFKVEDYEVWQVIGDTSDEAVITGASCSSYNNCPPPRYFSSKILTDVND